MISSTHKHAQSCTHTPVECLTSACMFVCACVGGVCVSRSLERSFDFVANLRWLIDNVLSPRGLVITSDIVWWKGEEKDDVGAISVINNQVCFCRVHRMRRGEG